MHEIKNIILADNQDITKAGLLYLLKENYKDLSYSFAPNKSELVSQLNVNEYSLIILDYTLFNFNRIEELLILRERFKNSVWLLFSIELSNSFLYHIAQNHLPISIVLKENSKEEILTAIHYTLKGKRFLCNYASNQLLEHRLQDSAPSPQLTRTETDILREIALGKTTKEIAASRNLSFHTVNTHRKNIFRKLEVNTIHEATKYAIRAGLIDLAEYYI